jgi:hypothetical protein
MYHRKLLLDERSQAIAAATSASPASSGDAKPPASVVSLTKDSSNETNPTSASVLTDAQSKSGK